MQFSREDIRKIIYYNWKRGLSTANNHKEINCILGEGTVGLRTCSDWVAKFNSGNFVCEDEPRSGRPSYNLEEEILTVLKEDPRATTRKIAECIGSDKETVRRRLIQMGKRYLCNVWIPYVLTDAAKTKRVTICEQLLRQLHRNNFLYRLITADETWVYWQNSDQQRHKSWRGAGDKPVTESKTLLIKKKFMLSLFWDSQGIILMDVLPPYESITTQYYCDHLEKLNEAFFEKRRR